jgi:hypothetical protein
MNFGEWFALIYLGVLLVVLVFTIRSLVSEVRNKRNDIVSKYYNYGNNYCQANQRPKNTGMLLEKSNYQYYNKTTKCHHQKPMPWFHLKRSITRKTPNANETDTNPALLILVIFFVAGMRLATIAQICFLAMWGIHYLGSAFIYPLNSRISSKPFPLGGWQLLAAGILPHIPQSWTR